MTRSTQSLRELFRASEEQSKKLNCQQAAVFGAVFMLVGVTLDMVVYPDMVRDIFFNRLITAVLLVVLGFLVRIVASVILTRLVIHTIAILPLASISYMIYQTEGALSPYYGGLNLVLVGATLLLRWSTFDSAINVALCLLTYAWALFSYGSDWGDAFIPSYFIFVTGAIASTGTYFYNQGRFREFCLTREVADANEKLENTNQQLRAMDETKSRFFANLSHELRTPLTLILGPTENLRASKKIHGDPILEEHLDTIEDNGYRLLRLINDILDLVKLDSGESPPRPESVQVDDFISGLTSNLKPIAELKGINISCHCNAVDRKTVWLDRDRLEKIILNLAVNAVKFTAKGGAIALSADILEDDLVLSVADTGEGMSEEDVANVFVRFWQADMSARRKHRGAGIGLSLVKSLTESMGGDVQVESQLGKGTTFTVRIPAPEPPEGADEPGIEARTADVLEKFNEQARIRTDHKVARDTVENDLADTGPDTLATGDGSRRKKKRVLVADDEEAMRKFIVRQLVDYELVQASDGTEAWELALSTRPDLIILDLMMPGMDGIEVTRRIRESDELARVPIILITAQASESPRLEALEAGVNDFISKPFSTVELSVRAKSLLDSSEFEVQLAENHVQLELAYGQLKEQESLLVQTEKLSSLGRMSAGIVHEVNNPLNYTKTALHALKTFKEGLPEDEREDFLDVLEDAQEGVQRVIGIVSDLRSFTRGDAALMREQNLSEIVESARRLTSSALSGIEFAAEIDPALEVEGNEGQLCQLFVNLLQNAARAIEVKRADYGPFDGKISLRASVDADGGVLVTLRDNGCGIKEEDIDRIYEPFFTKNDVGEGMGLGLSICHRILKQHKATINLESEVGKFTEFTIRFNY
ncbi:MAG: response regulator [Akkermansiaceae bacterium]|nr:response regulator [Akkermansiaceae bacterium]